jgi:hypothetical protein
VAAHSDRVYDRKHVIELVRELMAPKDRGVSLRKQRFPWKYPLMVLTGEADPGVLLLTAEKAGNPGGKPVPVLQFPAPPDGSSRQVGPLYFTLSQPPDPVS